MNRSESIPSPNTRRSSGSSASGNKFTTQDSTSMSALHHRSIQGNREHERKRDILMQGGRLLRERQTSEDASINPLETNSLTPDSSRYSPKLLESSRYTSSLCSLHSSGSTSSLHHLQNGLMEGYSSQESRESPELTQVKRQYKERLLEIAELENDRCV